MKRGVADANGPTIDMPTTEGADAHLPQHAERLALISRERFDARFIRNMFFITNLNRLLRLKLSRELTQSRNVVRSSHAAVAAGVTEYGLEAFGPNEWADSRYPGGEARYSDGQ